MSSFWGPIVSGFVATGLVYLLSRSGRHPAKRTDTRRALAYGVGFKLFSALLVPGSVFVAYTASQAQPSQIVLASCIASAFLISAVVFAYQAFLVTFEYDESNIYYKSPLAGSHEIPWSDVQELGYSGFVQSHYIGTPVVRRIWCSSMLQGHEEFAEFLNKKAEELFGNER